MMIAGKNSVITSREKKLDISFFILKRVVEILKRTEFFPYRGFPRQTSTQIFCENVEYIKITIAHLRW